jgi:hypothetical protein
MAGALLQHFGRDPPGHVEEAAEVDRDDRRVILVRIAGEGLRNEDAGVVDQAVDAAEALERLRDDSFGRLGIGDVAGDSQNVRIRGRLDRTGVGDDAIIAIAISLDQFRADALRCAGDNDDFLLCTPERPP